MNATGKSIFDDAVVLKTQREKQAWRNSDEMKELHKILFQLLPDGATLLELKQMYSVSSTDPLFSCLCCSEDFASFAEMTLHLKDQKHVEARQDLAAGTNKAKSSCAGRVAAYKIVKKALNSMTYEKFIEPSQQQLEKIFVPAEFKIPRFLPAKYTDIGTIAKATKKGTKSLSHLSKERRDLLGRADDWIIVITDISRSKYCPLSAEFIRSSAERLRFFEKPSAKQLRFVLMALYPDGCTLKDVRTWYCPSPDDTNCSLCEFDAESHEDAWAHIHSQEHKQKLTTLHDIGKRLANNALNPGVLSLHENEETTSTSNLMEKYKAYFKALTIEERTKAEKLRIPQITVPERPKIYQNILLSEAVSFHEIFHSARKTCS